MSRPSSNSSYVMVPHDAGLTHGKLRLSPKALAHPEPITDLIYGGFLEHLGKCIYGGIVDDPRNPSPKELLVCENKPKGTLGWRRDIMDVIGANGELQVPMLRWPGGNFVSNYHWQDGVGPMSERPKRIELAWLSDESNLFGTNEYIDYCRATGCKPYICLNMGTGSLEEALAWVEYCNGAGDTRWANLRRSHTGRSEPHNVEYWGLGNESEFPDAQLIVWGPWQVGNLKAHDYAEKARIWAHAIRLVDPSVKLVSCGREGNNEWDSIVLEAVAGLVDMHSIHFYTTLGQEKFADLRGYEYESNVFGPAAAEKSIEICKAMIDNVNIRRSSSVDPMSLQRLVPRDIKIAYDEWNVWDEVKAPGSNGLAQAYDFTDMLGFVGWLHVLVRKHGDLGLACLAQTVNVISPLMTTANELLRQTTFYPCQLRRTFSEEGKDALMSSGPTYPHWIRHVATPAYVDIVAMYTPGSIRVSVLNRHPTADFEFDLELDGFNVTSIDVEEMYEEHLGAMNTFADPFRCVPRHVDVDLSVTQLVNKHSWRFYVCDGIEI